MLKYEALGKGLRFGRRIDGQALVRLHEKRVADRALFDRLDSLDFLCRGKRY